ncbi:hypothetical protein [Streptomyces sp. NPDC001604]|uniref:hypothetical protein n=1 Tax=Streptomyces sp. NPDC001604 TaxID=3364593 RepID=UPI00367CF6F1
MSDTSIECPARTAGQHLLSQAASTLSTRSTTGFARSTSVYTFDNRSAIAVSRWTPMFEPANAAVTRIASSVVLAETACRPPPAPKDYR